MGDPGPAVNAEAALAGAMESGADPVLGVARSATGRRWLLRPGDDRVGLALAQGFELPDVVGRAMAARGIDPDTAGSFLAPRLRDLLPDPSTLQDMDAAAARLVRAVQDGEAIAVFGDYDVDGATAGALLARFFAAVGVPLRLYIPDRIAEGYGPNTPALMRLRAEGMQVIITVDCGISAFEPLAAAAEAGLDVVVVDHHTAESRLPDAAAVVNPNRLDDTSGQGALAAVGVAFLLAIAVNRGLRAAGWYGERREPDLLALLDLVALGTVCDVVPLTGLNRALVSQGLIVMARRQNPGLVALADVAGATDRPDAYLAGFILGPRVNAGGRVGEAGLGVQLLTTKDAGEAHAVAAQLDQYNRERREIEARVLAEALAQVEDGSAAGDGLILAVGDGWHPGVIGIVAGRLKDRFHKPVFVVALDGDVGKGSGRSIGGIDLGAMVVAARQAGLLINGGGHKMAAGITVARDQVSALRAFLDSRVSQEIAEKGIVPTLMLDGVVAAGGAQLALVEALERLKPFGAGNAEPRFALDAVRVKYPQVVGSDHVRCSLTGADGSTVKAIAFRAAGQALGALLMGNHGLPIHVAGKLRLDNWQGRQGVQMVVDDAAPVNGPASTHDP